MGVTDDQAAAGRPGTGPRTGRGWHARTTARGRVLTGWAAILATLAVAGGLLPAGPAPLTGVAAATGGRLVAVIVTPAPGADDPAAPGAAGGHSAAEQAVLGLGGRLGHPLGIVPGFTAQLPQARLAALRATPAVRAVTADAPLHLLASDWRPENSAGSLFAIAQHTGASDAWTRSDVTKQRLTGKDVGVALIDSGVVPVKGLDGPGKVINGPDLSFDAANARLRHLDGYGHGTHLAGIIAGRDPEVSDGHDHDAKYFVGLAPDAHVVSVKVAAANGATDVSQVIAAIDWVVTHRADPGLNIRVLNLSFGTDSTQDPTFDPLSYAAEMAWHKGIVVVVSAGNRGTDTTRLSMPAANPYVLAVGAVDPVGNGKASDDKVADFSSRGNTNRHADLAADGMSVVSLRDPGSYIDQHFPTGAVPGDAEQRFFRGSGTSQAAAVVSGAAALLLQQRPGLTPDQVKKLLTSTARPMKKADDLGQGAGRLDIRAALDAATPVTVQDYRPGLGTGSLEGSRGSVHVLNPVTGAELRGEQGVIAAPSGASWSGASWSGASWSGASWSGASWSGASWSGASWSGASWSGASWSGASWSGASWESGSWG